MTARRDEKGKYAVWVSPIQESRKWPVLGWLYGWDQGRDRVILTWDTVEEARAWLKAAVTWWETRYEIKEYVA